MIINNVKMQWVKVSKQNNLLAFETRKAAFTKSFKKTVKSL